MDDLIAAAVAIVAVAAAEAEREGSGGRAPAEPEDYVKFDWRLEDKSDKWIESHLRFRRDEIQRLCVLLRINEIKYYPEYKPTAEFALSLVLYRLSFPVR